MVFTGRINRFDKREMSDGGVIYECRMSDVSKPFALRTNGEFVTYLSEDKRKLLPQGDEIYDSEITIVAREMAPGQGGTIKIKGDVYAGVISPEKLTGNGSAAASAARPQSNQGKA